MTERQYTSENPFDLLLTAAPVAWGKGRWPNVDWIDGAMVWVGWEDGAIVYRIIRQISDGAVLIDGDANASQDVQWLAQVLGWHDVMPDFTDPVIASLSLEMRGLRPFTNGSLFDGVISAIVGQSISVAAAATTDRRLAQLVCDGVDVSSRRFYPSPRAQDLARLSVAEIRTSGVTGRRAEAIAAIAQRALDGDFPADDLRQDEAALRQQLRSLPLVGPWTAESTMLWGIGMPDIHPTGDVALLRAVRKIYERPDLTMKELDQLAQGWAPGRSWAARLLWTKLLGSVPAQEL